MLRFWMVCALVAGVVLVPAAAARLQVRDSAPVSDRVIAVTAKRFAFVPDRLEATEGERVTLIVRSADTSHGIEIRKLKLVREIPRGGDAVMLTFPAPAPGTYDILCSEYCGRGHDRMRATLVVSPRSAGGAR